MKKTLSLSDFKQSEIYTDALGNHFIKRAGVARILDVCETSLRTAYREKYGFKPLAARRAGFVVYLLEDVAAIYNMRD